MADQADNNIFGGTPAAGNAPAGTGAAPNNDDLATLLGSIKNERGEPKYKNVQEALNALKHSQEYIPTLKDKAAETEQKLNEAMAKLAKMETLEATVLQLTQKVDNGGSQPAGLSEEQVAELVTRTLSKTQQENLAKQNLEGVAKTVKAKFGDKAEEVFYGKAEELGMSKAEFNALAARTPKAVLKLIGIEEGTQASRQPVSFNTAGFEPRQDSLMGRNKKTALTGATTQDLREESANAAKLVTELHAQGKSVYDLTDPKVFFQVFK